MSKTVKDAERSIFKGSSEVSGTAVAGPTPPFSLAELVAQLPSIGAQATELGKAIGIVRKMRKEKVTVYLGYTSNMVSTGMREVICWLVRNRMVDILVTTAGGVEEDIIKTHRAFVVGDFRADGARLRAQGVNRIGNIYAPNERYVWFESFFQPLLAELLAEQAAGRSHGPCEVIWRLGEKCADESSIYYWAAKHRIPVYCPGFMDGAIGDNCYFFGFHHPEFRLDMVADHKELIERTLKAKETGIIVLGAGIVKHTICNANMFREGAKYAVYVNTAAEFDASDSGALPEEAKSWGKIAARAETVKVFCDATIAFPLLVAGAFVD